MQQQIVDNRYRIVRPLGSGGMADVYLAHDDVLDRDVALKVMSGRYADDEEFVERFRREAQSAAALGHPNIVSIYDRGEDESGTYYIAMEYLPGGTLKDRIVRRGALPARTATAVALQIAEALQVAHRAGVVHRDIKPHNVLITGNGDVKVTDFGIARAASSSTMTRTGSILGTAHYISPEQAMGEPVAPQSDLYSLGVVLYEMLTGEMPFDAETPIGIAMKHVNGHVVPPKDKNPEVPDGINAITLRLLEKKPDDRYDATAELIDDLERVLDGLDPSDGTTHLMTTRLAPAGLAAVNNGASRDGGTTAMSVTRPAPAPPRTYGREDDGDNSRRMWLPILMLLLLLALLAVVAYAFTSAGGLRQTQPPNGVEVPNLLDATDLAEAERIAARNGFEVEVRDDGVESEEAVGSIVDQSPNSGTKIERGSAIEVDVVGTRIAQIPDVTDASEGEATRRLRGAGFEFEVERRESESNQDGQVIEQDPEGGGQPEPVGSTVKLTVGSGPATAGIPDLSGLTLGEAEAELEGEGFSLGDQEEAPSESAPEGEVFDQDPNAGVEVREGTAVNVVVSTGPELIEVPSVVGQDIASAEQTLANAGLALGSEEEAPSDDAPAGQVLDQSPGGGEAVEAGTAVGVTVSTGPDQVTVPDIVGQTLTSARRDLEDAGFSLGDVNRLSSESTPRGEVFDQDPDAGAEVEEGAAIDVAVSTGPEEPEPAPEPGPTPEPPSRPESPESPESPDPPTEPEQPGGIVVPNVVGRNWIQASNTLRAAGLDVVQEVERVPSDAPENTVLATNPSAGSRVDPNVPITLTTSSGPSNSSSQSNGNDDAQSLAADILRDVSESVRGND